VVVTKEEVGVLRRDTRWRRGTIQTGVIAILALVVSACSTPDCVGSGATSASTFQVVDVGVQPGDYYTPSSPFQTVVRIQFNRTVDTSTLTAPGDASGSVDITLVGTNDGRKAENIEGTFQFPADPAAQIETTFESVETGSDLINPQAGENIEYQIRLSGDILDTSGNQLDADHDGTAGGSCTEVFEVIG
jgi:hypothetical protein